MFQKLAMPLVLAGVAAFAPSLASADSVGTVRAIFCENSACNSGASDSLSASIRSGSDDADFQLNQGQDSASQTFLEKHDIPSDRFSTADSKPSGLDSYTRHTFHFVRVPHLDGTGEPPTGPSTPVPAPEPSTLAMLILGLGAIATGIGQRKRFIQS